MARKKRETAPGNFVSEWMGHRVYPSIVTTPESIADQKAERCPFLTAATGEERKCVKHDKAKGVCTISSVSNGPRQDWLACPYRALSHDLLFNAVRCLFGLSGTADPFITPAISLKRADVRTDVITRLSAGQPVFIYFDAKMGGELSIPATERSPEFAFDVTVVELVAHEEHPHIGRFGILEIQTMDFHGSYRHAVHNLREGLRMHPTRFGQTLQDNQWWLSEGVEGPNIANVFKRTFYQMMFKFQLGQHDRCAGCVLAIPQAVWDSWQRHLGAPVLTPEPDGTLSLLAPGAKRLDPSPAWIYVFDPDASAAVTPSPIAVTKLIATDAPSISHWALEVAPAAALSNIDAEAGLLAVLSRRIHTVWPELAKTVTADIATEELPVEPGPKRRRPRRRDVPIEKIAETSGYAGPSEEAVKGDEPDED
ncbi:MAG: hypothetical protein IT533_15665 [Hyphomicrobiales bacterium]|nr:hypothetical protein [Hyphomicrobiales bacterium]